jgi:sec-independent protein translocase protein TatA
MPNLRGWEWLILVAIILLLFGAKRLPDAARGIGRSLRIFKAETKGLAEDDAAKADGAKPDTVAEAAPAAPAVTPAAPPAVAAPPAPQSPSPEPVAERTPERTEG